MTMLVQIPKHDNTVLTSGGTQSTVGADSDGVDVTGVTQVVNLKLGGGRLEVPDLDELVPAGRDDLGIGRVGREANGGNPFSVTSEGSVTTGGGLSNKVTLAFTTSVPDLDGLVAGTGNDQTVVGREGSRQNVSSVTDKVADGFTIVQVPKTHSLIPGSSQSILSILREGNVLDEVVVTLQGTLRNTIAFTITSQVPDNSGLIYKVNMNKMKVSKLLKIQSY